MREFIILLLLPLTAIACRQAAAPPSDVTEDEYQMYKILVDSLYLRGENVVGCVKFEYFVTLDSTMPNRFRHDFIFRRSDGGRDTLREPGPLEMIVPLWAQLDHDQMAEDYAMMNSRRSAFAASSIKSPVRQIQISTDSLRAIFAAGHEDLFYRIFPASNGTITFSRAGFNLKRDQALIYVEHFCASLSATGSYAVFQKENGIWILKFRVPDWVS